MKSNKKKRAARPGSTTQLMWSRLESSPATTLELLYMRINHSYPHCPRHSIEKLTEISHAKYGTVWTDRDHSSSFTAQNSPVNTSVGTLIYGEHGKRLKRRGKVREEQWRSFGVATLFPVI